VTRRDRRIAALCATILAASAVVLVLRLRGRGDGDDDDPPPAAPEPGVISVREPDGMSFELYIPAGLDRTKVHPLVFGSSPSGNGRELVSVWRQACDRFQWILIGSNNARNGAGSVQDDELQRRTLARAVEQYGADLDWIYVIGMSGGGMHSYQLLEWLPAAFRGLVVNTGMMPHRWPGNAPFDAAHYPRGKQIVMIASPADFRYGAMTEDRELLEAAGWAVDWIEFPGGHQYAPPEVYVQAAAWLTAR
jgi:predicted esterase